MKNTFLESCIALFLAANAVLDQRADDMSWTLGFYRPGGGKMRFLSRISLFVSGMIAMAIIPLLILIPVMLVSGYGGMLIPESGVSQFLERWSVSYLAVALILVPFNTYMVTFLVHYVRHSVWRFNQ